MMFMVRKMPRPVRSSSVLGGAASPAEVATSVRETEVDAVAVAGLLHYGRTTVAEIKTALAAEGLPVRPAREAGA